MLIPSSVCCFVLYITYSHMSLKIFYPTRKVNIGEINSNLFYLTQYMQNIIIPTSNQYQKITKLLYTYIYIIFILSLQNPVCILHSQSRLAPLQKLDRHMRPVDTTWKVQLKNDQRLHLPNVIVSQMRKLRPRKTK